MSRVSLLSYADSGLHARGFCLFDKDYLKDYLKGTDILRGLLFV